MISRLLYLFPIILLIEFYFYKKFTNSLIAVVKPKNPKVTKRIIGGVLLFLNAYLVIGLVILISIAFGGGRPKFPPDNTMFDIFIQFPFWIMMFVLVQSILILLPIDIVRLLLFPFYRKHREKVKSIIYKIQFAVIVFFVIYVPVRSYYDYSAVSLRVVEYHKKGLPEALNNFSLVLISDVQADKYTNVARLDRFISKVNSVNPDLVLVGGDIITSTPDYIKLGAEYIGKIKSKYGVYSCVGDHDNWAYRPDIMRSRREVIQALNDYNVKMYDDRNISIPVDSAKIGVTIITNTYSESVKASTLDSLTREQNGDDLKILLTHQPRQFIVDEAVKNNYDLYLAGHTHGGQVTFLFPFFNLTPTLLETSYVKGDFHFGNMLMVVTRGLGMSLVPLRYNSTPEITLIKLIADK